MHQCVIIINKSCIYIHINTVPNRWCNQLEEIKDNESMKHKRYIQIYEAKFVRIFDQVAPCVENIFSLWNAHVSVPLAAHSTGLTTFILNKAVVD